jgi:hypothetical protein
LAHDPFLHSYSCRLKERYHTAFEGGPLYWLGR